MNMEDVSMFDLRPGNNVGGYTLISRLGGGAMGSVWRVCDGGGNQYAMKILRASVSANQSEDEDEEQMRARLRLKREALALQKIHHPGVCSIVDMELDDSIAFIVTELIEGRNLREDVAENGPYVADDLERLAHKLIEAVQAVHDAGIIHRDIKPTNVMIAAHGPVLVDFGISMGEGESHVTRTGLVMGTPGFIAPEIIDGDDSDELTDWWSLVSVLAFAATGKPVFGTKPLMAVLERAASGNADLSGLPTKTMDAFRKALQPDRQKRCSPYVLEHAISEDAMNPLVWPEASRPFDYSAARGNMREMWRETKRETKRETDTDETNTDKTIYLESSSNADATCVVSANENALDSTSTIPVNSTTVMPKAGRQASNQNTISSEQNNLDNRSDDLENSSDDLDNEYDDLDNKSEQNTDPSQYEYLYRGSFALLICLLVCAAIACLNVLDAAGLCILITCVSSAAGYNISARLRRKQLNNGVLPRHDAVIRIASLPWHIIRGILYTIPRIVVVVIVSCVGSVAYPYMLSGTPELLSIKLGFLNIFLPTYAPTIFSQTSVGYAIGFLIAWFILAVCKSTTIFCLGLGALFTPKNRTEE